MSLQFTSVLQVCLELETGANSYSIQVRQLIHPPWQVSLYVILVGSSIFYSVSTTDIIFRQLNHQRKRVSFEVGLLDGVLSFT